MATFTAQQITRSHIIQLNALPQQVFPLFEPLGEKLWTPAWDPDMLYPPSGIAQEGTVFTTRHGTGPVTIWLITEYNAALLYVTYVRMLPDSHVGKIEVQCEPGQGEETTQARITYTLTALTSAGNELIAAFTYEHYLAWMHTWEEAINQYIQQVA
jgi:hypothetical protein